MKTETETEIKMKLQKTTKSTDVYSPVDESQPQPVTTLYVQKWFSKGREELTITITE